MISRTGRTAGPWAALSAEGPSARGPNPEPRSLSGCLGVFVSAPLPYDCLCVYVFVCLPFSLLSLSLTLCEFLALSLSVAVYVCVCVCLEAKSHFLRVGLSLVSLSPRLCLGRVSACQPFWRRIHFGFVKAWTP